MKVDLQDERLSTVEATNYMIKADISRKKRKEKIDSLAANIILQTYLDKKKGN
jgi:putative Holliday junction resolvase